MKFTITLVISLSFGIATAQEVGPRHEIGLTLGGLFGSQRSGGLTRLDLGSGVALQANYGYRLLGNETAALYGEVHFLANPLRQVNSKDQTLTRDAATIFLTPGLRVKFFPNCSVAPYLALGGGWAVYEQSTNTLNGNPNPASRLVNHGAFDYGGGWISSSGDSSAFAPRSVISTPAGHPITPERLRARSTTSWRGAD